ncbi:MAG TPA: L-rhamnose isomerase [Candidatus Hydrogenedens sp.]|nr:L-rhamnose isomerase [Candidatus Hydrogenedens sp.]
MATIPEYRTNHIEKSYEIAREVFSTFKIDTNEVLKKLANIPVSLHCWQGDDVKGFEHIESTSSGGIQATGNYPGRARNADELRQDIEKAMSLIPGKHRINLHAIYAETQGKTVERDSLTPEYFSRWADWAKEKGLGVDFNPTCFAHPLADSGFTLSHQDQAIRKFWIRHCIACREIGAYFGKTLGKTCVTNIWIPDGYKDIPADRLAPRQRLKESLDEIFAVNIDETLNKDSIESKLFGIGSECYVVGSHEFYMGYAVQKKKVLCLDMGHFHPTESIADKLSAVLLYIPEVLLHISRGVRWDSDHVVIMNDDVNALMEEVVRHNLFSRVYIGLDFFDASINRISAWVIGTRSVLRALLKALLEPTNILKELENQTDYSGRLMLLEETKNLPWSAVWDYYCLKNNVPIGPNWFNEIKKYEQAVLSQRNR